MTVTIAANNEFASTCAQRIMQQVALRPDSVLCVSTGTTTRPIFGEIVRQHKASKIDFSQTFFFNVDNYLDMPRENPASINARLERDLYFPLGLGDGQYYIPTATSGKAAAEIEFFGELIEQKCGIDLMLLCVGGDGHIAFNVPGTPFGTGIYIAQISQNIVTAKSRLFGGADNVPKRGITMGIKTIMQARRILLVACGAHKASVMQAAIHGPVTEDLPVSVLQLHPAVEVILDEDAAAVSNGV